MNIGNFKKIWLLDSIDVIGDKLVSDTTINYIGLLTDDVQRIMSRRLAQMNAFL